ncbi:MULTISPECIES: hypothetical protein [unclassified Pseudomonas]|nr:MULTISPECIES: hypothetical protein [unclassified Pseudomonas]QIH07604.1 hypothetical protein ATY02_13225 [Pseudomonas sp. BIOMIG1BAC]
MKYLLVVLLFVLVSGCQYFSYQDSCEDDPDQASCAGLNTQQPAKSQHRR